LVKIIYYNIDIKVKFGLSLEGMKILQFTKRWRLKWDKITNIRTKSRFFT